jgi:hypothetical protein
MRGQGVNLEWSGLEAIPKNQMMEQSVRVGEKMFHSNGRYINK